MLLHQYAAEPVKTPAGMSGSFAMDKGTPHKGEAVFQLVFAFPIYAKAEFNW